MSDLIHVNGIDGRTGELAVPPLTREQLARAVLGGLLPLLPLRPAAVNGNMAPIAMDRLVGLAEAAPLRGLRSLAAENEPQEQPVTPPLRDSEIARLGWGVIFAKDADPTVRQALQPLLDLRRRQASSQRGDFYREFAGDDGCEPGESKQQFLERLHIEPGPANPAHLPYYLLLVGSPTQIPFRFQEQMRSRHAVGRLHLDSPAEYANYAATVVAIEAGRQQRAKGAAFFAPAHDEVTEESRTRLVQPLAKLAGQQPGSQPVTTRFGHDATRRALVDLLRGNEPPAVLFAAGHGLRFDKDDPLQASRQGALVCPERGKKLHERGQFFMGEDVAALGDLRGLVAFLFACFGAGTPRLDDFASRSPGAVTRAEIASAPFLADLPKRMLGRRNGAQAIIGHVDRAWADSFGSLVCYRRLVRRLLAGHTVGHAMDPMSWRYLDLSSDLCVVFEEMRYGVETLNNMQLSELLLKNNDARDFVILGDPAVRAVDPVR